MSKLISLAAGALLAGSVAAAVPAHASKYSVVYSFQGGNDGAAPFSGMIAVDGTLYGTTYFGGTANLGTVYAVTLAGTETTLHSFQGGADGVNPWGGLLNVNGMLYGTTNSGGDHNFGILFNMTTGGDETILHNFAGHLDGTNPVGSLIKSGPALYSTTSAGGFGAGCGEPGCGTVFKWSGKGDYSVLYRFPVGDANSPLGTLLPFNGELYGTSYQGGADQNNPLGALFKVTKDGTETLLHTFGAGLDGADPVGGLINVDGTFYGTTESGGDNEYGTVFKVTPAGDVTVMYSFKGGKTDGAGPQTALIYAGGALWGTTGNGGREGLYGTVFKITLDGQETVVHKFDTLDGPDGSVPLGNLIKVGANLYGTTYGGGTHGHGSVFQIKP